MAPSNRRFIKKVPNSGGPPAFKLTLPHQVVNNHLQHLVDKDFELAPSEHAQQTWQGSIAPRRNKERSEYTLQGWKLFAEAHKVKAGDQVSFDLVAPYRMVIQIIRPGDITASPQDIPEDVPSTTCYRDVPSPASKSLKLSQQCSPASCSHQADLPFMGVGESELWPLPLDGADLDVWKMLPASNAQLSGGSEEGSSHKLDSNADQAGGRLLAHQNSQFLAPASPTNSSRFGVQQQISGADCGVPQAQSRKRGHSPSGRLPRATDSASTLFTDMMRSPDSRCTQEPGTPALPVVANEYFDAEDSDTSNDATGAHRSDSASHLNLQLGSLTATIQSLQTNVQHFESRADCAEKEVNNLRALYEKLQGALDRRTRDALRAETGLERTAFRLSAPQLLAAVDAPTAETLLAIQSDLFNCLNSLKHSLWELLVLTLGDAAGFSVPNEGV